MTSDQLLIRSAEPQDLAALETVEERSWDDSSSPGMPSEELLMDSSLPVQQTWVAAEGSKVVGYVTLGRRTLQDTNRHVGEIKVLAVGPEHRGRGIGKQLLGRAIEEARQMGFAKLSLRALSSNPAVLTMAESMGFQQEARLAREYLIEGQYVDDITLSLWL